LPDLPVGRRKRRVDGAAIREHMPQRVSNKPVRTWKINFAATYWFEVEGSAVGRPRNAPISDIAVSSEFVNGTSCCWKISKSATGFAMGVTQGCAVRINLENSVFWRSYFQKRAYAAKRS
jgi:hypothetical protein